MKNSLYFIKIFERIWFFKIFFYLSLCVCVCVWVCAGEWVLGEGRRRRWIGSCELPNVGAASRPWVICKWSQCCYLLSHLLSLMGVNFKSPGKRTWIRKYLNQVGLCQSVLLVNRGEKTCTECGHHQFTGWAWHCVREKKASWALTVSKQAAWVYLFLSALDSECGVTCCLKILPLWPPAAMDCNLEF